MTTDVVPNGKEGEKVNGHEALDLAETTEGANKQVADVRHLEFTSSVS